MPYLIAYDITHPRRLRRIARLLERHAFRCQKSVFWYTGNFAALQKLLQQLETALQPQHDVIQAWPVAPATTPEGVYCGTPRLRTGPAVVAVGTGVVLVGAGTHPAPELEF